MKSKNTIFAVAALLCTSHVYSMQIVSHTKNKNLLKNVSLAKRAASNKCGFILNGGAVAGSVAMALATANPAFLAPIVPQMFSFFPAIMAEKWEVDTPRLVKDLELYDDYTYVLGDYVKEMDRLQQEDEWSVSKAEALKKVDEVRLMRVGLTEKLEKHKAEVLDYNKQVNARQQIKVDKKQELIKKTAHIFTGQECHIEDALIFSRRQSKKMDNILWLQIGTFGSAVVLAPIAVVLAWNDLGLVTLCLGALSIALNVGATADNSMFVEDNKGYLQKEHDRCNVIVQLLEAAQLNAAAQKAAEIKQIEAETKSQEVVPVKAFQITDEMIKEYLEKNDTKVKVVAKRRRSEKKE